MCSCSRLPARRQGSHTMATSPTCMDRQLPPPPTTSMTLMHSGGNETSGNETTTHESGDQGGNDTDATNATRDTPPPESEQTCRPTLTHIAVRPGGGSQWCACAVERKDCTCAGLVQFGFAENSLWAPSLWTNGTITCRSASFGSDPAREKSPCFLCPLA